MCPSWSCEVLGECTLGWGYQGRLMKWAKQVIMERQRLREGAVQTGGGTQQRVVLEYTRVECL